jgi:UDP:flavonoid glycosyltransferase YjiC (YdhE family)
MPQAGHFDTLLPLISGLTRRGLEAMVFTAGRFQSEVERAGGTFVDLFARYPIEPADDESHPAPSRYVTFAGHYAEEILDDLAKLGPSLVVHDAHAVIGQVAGAGLGVPYVTLCPGHNATRERLDALLETLPRIHISAACDRAVEHLKRVGLEDASPFSFVSLSPFLNLYGEPPAYLTERERGAFEPVAFQGCLPALDEINATSGAPASPYFDGDDAVLKLYISFGTVIWRYFPAEALDALRALSETLCSRRDVQAVISLGGADLPTDAERRLARPNVAIRSHVDQWRILREADAFVTHNGRKSTHEAVFNEIPMISYPIFWDQPSLAERCHEFGLAVPLVDSTLGKVAADDVHAALEAVSDSGEAMRASLAEAREWELRVLEERDSVLDRITDLL